MPRAGQILQSIAKPVFSRARAKCLNITWGYHGPRALARN
jgi:hypothetical protein